MRARRRPVERRRNGFLISTDPARVDLALVHGFLTKSYWARGITAALVRRSLRHSIVFGLYHRRRQIGFARLITDRATFAYVADVFVVPAYRGRGLATWLMETILAHPDLQGLRRWLLATRDAHGLYRKVGFSTIRAPERWMEISAGQER